MCCSKNLEVRYISIIHPFLINLTTLSLCFLASCNTSSPPSTLCQSVKGRDEDGSRDRPLLYQAFTPLHWLRKDSPETESIKDTTKSICEFYIQEKDQSIRITIHTFPIEKNFPRIPPIAQVSRWKKQFEEADPLSIQVIPDAHGGFSGLFFEGQGLLKGVLTQVMGWSMQLSEFYVRQFTKDQLHFNHRQCADYTIKASGPPELMKKHHADLLAFARSFELIEELPFSP